VKKLRESQLELLESKWQKEVILLIQA